MQFNIAHLSVELMSLVTCPKNYVHLTSQA